MFCFNCKGDLSNKLVNHNANLGNKTIIVKDVPALVCSQCGEYMIDNSTMEVLEKLIKNLENTDFEVLVVNFPSKVFA